MQPHQRIEAIFQDHHHVDAAQQFAQHDALIDALPRVERIAQVAYIFPILKGRALIVAPEFRARVQRREIGERFHETARRPVGRAACQILRNVETERHRQFLILDGGDIEIGGRRDPPLGERDAIIDRPHGAAAEELSGHEFGALDRCGEVFEYRFAVGAEPEQ